MESTKKSLLQVHTAVFLFGLTGLFGKYITLNPFIIVLGRVFFSMIFIGLWMLLKKESFKLASKRDYAYLAFMGLLLSLHWASFFGSVQVSTVAVGLLSFSTFPVFVSLLSPLLGRGPIKKTELFYGSLTLMGILLIVPFNDLLGDTSIGAMIGVFSGAVYALFTSLNENLVKRYPGKLVAFYEQVFSTMILLPFYLFLQPEIDLNNLLLLILLGTIFTGIGHTLFISGLKHVSAYSAAMITMLEPIYAIILALITLGEPITLRIFFGGAIILSTVLMISLQNAKNS